jgi:hypothetical protein
MPLLEFEGCRQRIRRAKAHRETFRDLWNKHVLEDDFYSVGLHMDDDGAGSIWVRPNHRRDFTDVLSLELGEMLYQLRAALDSSIYATRVRETGTNPPPEEHRLEFPICKSRAQFDSFKRAPVAPKRLSFIESMQPYNAPELSSDLVVYNFNRTLGILNDWARIDRHRRVHVVGSWASNPNPHIICPEGTTLSDLHVTGTGFFEDECEIATFRLTGFRPEMKVHANPDVDLDIAVNEAPPPCSDTDTLGNRLLAMLKATASIIQTIEASF